MFRKYRYLLRATWFCCWVFVLSLFFAELLLQSAGVFVRMRASSSRDRTVDELSSDSVKILCVGDSHTFGMGAPDGMSYPAQLERMLNNRPGRGQKFTVINAGVPGATTLRVREELPGLIRLYKPATVLLFVGVNNYNWDTDYWFCASRNPVLRGLARTRLWRLFVMARIRVKTLLFARSLKRGLGNSRIEPESKRKTEELLGLADEYIDQGRFDDAFSCLMESLYSGFNFEIDFLCDDFLGGAGGWSVFIDVCRRMVRIPDAVERLEKHGADKRIITLVHRFITERVDIELRIRDWIINDMQTIVNICRANGAEPVIIGYFGEDKLYSALSSVAKQTGVSFINNAAVFDNLGAHRPEYFAPDRHPNARGYELIARQVLAVLDKSL